jgi:acyl-CoA synthetase (AMP-forming)/AMP-acid ligase II
MQPYSLTIDKFLDHAAKWFGRQEVIEADCGRVVVRTTYAELRERSNRLSGALAAIGVKVGDRVGTLAWNTRHHLEIYYAAMGMGAICHTLNPRLTVDHLAQIITEAEDSVLAAAASLMPLVQQLLARCPSIRHVIVLDATPSDVTVPNGVHLWPLEELLATKGAPVEWGVSSSNAPHSTGTPFVASSSSSGQTCTPSGTVTSDGAASSTTT